MTVFLFFNVFCDTLYILYMLFFMCVFIYLLVYWCDGHATIFKFKINFFHVHVVTYIVLPFPFLSTAVKFIFYVCRFGQK